MSFTTSVCEEFCEAVEEEMDPRTELIELKCTLQTSYLPPLMERMNQLGYACTHAQRDARNNKCFAWFQETCLN